ncbi:hypothetical protein BDV12DRAFT_192789 [Aspergillus spectabilis]
MLPIPYSDPRNQLNAFEGSIYNPYSQSNYDDLFPSISSGLYISSQNGSLKGYTPVDKSELEPQQQQQQAQEENQSQRINFLQTNPSPLRSGKESTPVSPTSSGSEDNTFRPSFGQSKKERRRLLNRTSQRAYRARKEAQFVQCQETIARLEGQISELERQRIRLIALNEYLIKQNQQSTRREAD